MAQKSDSTTSVPSANLSQYLNPSNDDDDGQVPFVLRLVLGLFVWDVLRVFARDVLLCLTRFFFFFFHFPLQASNNNDDFVTEERYSYVSLLVDISFSFLLLLMTESQF